MDVPLARMLLAKARTQPVVPLDVVSFTAACPACGNAVEWTQERRDTRVRSSIACSCQD